VWRADFVAGDVMEGVPGLDDSFDFAFDWEVFHHIFPTSVRRTFGTYIACSARGATYLSVSFSEHDSAFGGEGRFRTTPLGTVLCFSNEAEMRGLLEPIFELLDLRTVEVGGKTDLSCRRVGARPQALVHTDSTC